MILTNYTATNSLHFLSNNVNRNQIISMTIIVNIFNRILAKLPPQKRVVINEYENIEMRLVSSQKA